jgi:hypothetical protein
MFRGRLTAGAGTGVTESNSLPPARNTTPLQHMASK